MPEFGLPDTTLRTLRRILAESPAIDKAILYGSRALGNCRPGSDIDLTLIGTGLDLRSLGKITSVIEDSPIPYRVDLSLWEQINHAGLREHIERVGVVFYERDRAA